MVKVEVGSFGTTGPLQSMQREDSIDSFKGRGQIASGGTGTASSGRGSTRPTMASTLQSTARRKRKDRESDVDDNQAQSSRKKHRG
jgi:hypothetical protein